MTKVYQVISEWIDYSCDERPTDTQCHDIFANLAEAKLSAKEVFKTLLQELKENCIFSNLEVYHSELYFCYENRNGDQAEVSVRIEENKLIDKENRLIDKKAEITAKDIVALINKAGHKEWAKALFYMYGAGAINRETDDCEAFELDSEELDKMAEIYLDGYRYDIINNQTLDDLASMAMEEANS